MRLGILLVATLALTACGSHRATQTSVTVTVTKTIAQAAHSKQSRSDRTTITRLVHAAACGKGHECDISEVRFAKSDRSFASAGVHDPQIGSALVVLHRTGKRWKVIALGSSEVGCDKAPKRVRLDLALGCRKDRRPEQQVTPPPATVAAPPSPADPYNGHPGDKHFALYYLGVKDDGIGDIGGIARVKNVGSSTLAATFTFTLFQGGRIVGTAVGSANGVSPGQTVTVQLSSTDKMISGRFRYEFQVDAEF